MNKIKLFQPKAVISLLVSYVGFILIFLFLAPMGQFFGKKPIELNLTGTIGEWIVALILIYILHIFIINWIIRRKTK